MLEMYSHITVISYRTTENLPEILQSCDYVCNVLSTRDLLSGEMLKHCQNKVCHSWIFLHPSNNKKFCAWTPISQSQNI